MLNQQLKRYLDQAESILLVGHRDPDGDACGSLLALFYFLRFQGKNVVMYAPTKPAEYFNFFPALGEITSDPAIWKKKWSVIAFVDCADLQQARISREDLPPALIVNIDHHWSNSRYGRLNLVDAKASSTCEVIYNFFQAIGFSPDQRIAQALLAGILSDTGGLSNAATSAAAFKAAASLVSRGADVNFLSTNIFYHKNLATWRLWGLVFSRIKINRRWQLALVYAGEEELSAYQVGEAALDGLVDFLNIVSGVKAVCFFRLGESGIRVSCRSRQDKVNLAALAKIFGGGGHKKAAGFSLPWRLIEQNGRLELLD